MSDTLDAGVSLDELRLAARNHGMPLEALHYDVTPVGLHYLLTHYDIPVINAAGWRLTVNGLVGAGIELSLADLQAMPTVTRRVTMECAGNGRALLEPRPVSQPWLHEAVGTGEWTGVRVADVLARAHLLPGAVEVVFSGLDRGLEHGVEQQYQRSLPVSELTGPDALLAYAVNGGPLPPQHGFPLRLVVPGWYGMTNVKWLTAMTAVDEPFAGYQQNSSYRVWLHEGGDSNAEGDGEPVTRIMPRALMVPPGIPEFLTRVRHLAAGDHHLTGRAWSGIAPITSVEVSTDGGHSWSPAAVEPDGDSDRGHPLGEWQRWRYDWHATSGDHELCCRATDAAGNVQPDTPPWNVGGYRNNAIQRVRVTVG